MAKILLVEDDLPLMRLYESILQPEYDVIAVDTSAKAIEVINTQQPDVIILDLNLPDAPGTLILQHVEQNAALAQTRVVIMTGFSHYERRQMPSGVIEILNKPVTASMLLRVVKTAVTASKG